MEAMMRRSKGLLLFAGLAALVWSAGAGLAADEPKSEGHPHKWVAIEKSMFDLVSDGYDLVNVVYEPPRGSAPTDLPDVHYFLQKEHEVVRCDFRKREETSYYYCYTLSKSGG
jgi:hypothetical protein